MKFCALLLWSCLLTFVTPVPISSPSLLIGAFNVQTFGVSKMSKPDIAAILAKIVTRYDIMLLQEIRDKSETAIKDLLDLVKEIEPTYKFTMSGRLGRSSYKEQYAYFYRTDKVELISTHQYDDGIDDGTDSFAREPYCILAASKPFTSNTEMALCGIHAAPNDVIKELNGLMAVHDDVKNVWTTKNVMFLGDFNADGSYLSQSELDDLLMFKDKDYKWVIDSNEDTMVKTDNAYDRIVIYGCELKDAIITGTGQAYTFDSDFNLDTVDEVAEVSDHYPVEIRIQF